MMTPLGRFYERHLPHRLQAIALGASYTGMLVATVVLIGYRNATPIVYLDMDRPPDQTARETASSDSDEREHIRKQPE